MIVTIAMMMKMVKDMLAKLMAGCVCVWGGYYELIRPYWVIATLDGRDCHTTIWLITTLFGRHI